jgi:hypothetical protein
VAVDRPRVGALEARDEVAETGCRRRPQAESAVDVNPCADVVGRVANLPDRVEGARVHVAALRADDRRTGSALQRVAQLVGAHRALIVARDEPCPARPEAQIAKGGRDRDVVLVAEQHVDRRRAGEPVGLDVPPRARKDVIPSGGESREVRHHAAGDEADRRLRGQPQQLHEPAAGDLLRDRRGGPEGVKPRVLVPGGCQPLGRERYRQAPADHEPEEARTGRPHQPPIGVLGELLDHRDVIRRPLGQRTTKRGAQLVDRRRRRHRARGEPVEEPCGARGRLRERVARHRPTPVASGA